MGHRVLEVDRLRLDILLFLERGADPEVVVVVAGRAARVLTVPARGARRAQLPLVEGGVVARRGLQQVARGAGARLVEPAALLGAGVRARGRGPEEGVLVVSARSHVVLLEEQLRLLLLPQLARSLFSLLIAETASGISKGLKLRL